MCGPAEIDGYTFCLGLESLKQIYEALPDLQNLIPSIVYLIKEAIFRPTYQTSSPGRVSLDICPLGDLIDMFHTREAKWAPDKVYALLGMSSDGLGAAGLSPDYKVPWKELLQRLVEFLLGEHVSVEAWNHREMAVINCRGCVLGQAALVKNNQNDRENQSIVFKNTAEHLGYCEEYDWTIPASAKSIQDGDLVCLLKGAPKPTIIRPYKDHFVVIIIAATLPEAIRMETQLITDFPRDFLLVWDWETSQGKLQNRGKCQTLIETIGREHSKKELEDDLGRATRLRKAALVLQDSEKYEEAKERLQEAIESYERALGKESSHLLTVRENLALVYGKTRQWKEAEGLFMRVIQTQKRTRGEDDPATLSSMANLAITYKDQGKLKEARN